MGHSVGLGDTSANAGAVLLHELCAASPSMRPGAEGGGPSQQNCKSGVFPPSPCVLSFLEQVGGFLQQESC